MNSKTLFRTNQDHSVFKLPGFHFSKNENKEWRPKKIHPSGLIQTQTWADSSIDLLALNLKPAANIVTISAGACHALAYLQGKPAAVHCVDENPAQLALLEMKTKAIAHLPDYDAVLQFLLNPGQSDNLKRYQRHIRRNLSESASKYWQSRNFLGQPRYQIFSQDLQKHGLYNISLNCLRFVLKKLGADFKKILSAQTLEQQQSIFDQAILPALHKKSLRFLMNQQSILRGLGFSQNQIAQLKKVHEAHQNITTILIQRLRHLLCDFPIQNNHFALQVLGQTSPLHQQQSLPTYLQKEFFSHLRQYAHRIHGHQASLIDYLKQQPPCSIDVFVLQDHLDYLRSTEIKDLWIEVERCAAPQAKVLIRSLGTSLPLPQDVFCKTHTTWHTNPLLNQTLQAQDRCALYGSFFLLERN
jgi:S-adenosylmethionine-diacylglycerol 3-amino-3-carboxypropyl transferase